jgi:hypothetical protein
MLTRWALTRYSTTRVSRETTDWKHIRASRWLIWVARCPTKTLVVKGGLEKADAILVSQVVTQGNVHLANLTNLTELLEAEGWRDQVVLVAGGPRITHALALELGYDAGFGAHDPPSRRGVLPGPGGSEEEVFVLDLLSVLRSRPHLAHPWHIEYGYEGEYNY